MYIASLCYTSILISALFSTGSKYFLVKKLKAWNIPTCDLQNIIEYYYNGERIYIYINYPNRTAYIMKLHRILGDKMMYK